MKQKTFYIISMLIAAAALLPACGTYLQSSAQSAAPSVPQSITQPPENSTVIGRVTAIEEKSLTVQLGALEKAAPKGGDIPPDATAGATTSSDAVAGATTQQDKDDRFDDDDRDEDDDYDDDDDDDRDEKGNRQNHDAVAGATSGANRQDAAAGATPKMPAALRNFVESSEQIKCLVPDSIDVSAVQAGDVVQIAFDKAGQVVSVTRVADVAP